MRLVRYIRMKNLFQDKYFDPFFDESDLLNWEDMKQNRYGFVYVKNPHYIIEGDDRKYLIRKPTP